MFDGRAWTVAHEAWLRGQVFELPVTRAAFDDCCQAVLTIRLRRDGLDEKIADLSATLGSRRSSAGPGVCAGWDARGVRVVRRDRRLDDVVPERRSGSCLGLVASEHRSGQKHTRGSITKAGNSHARRLLVEAAWHHRKPHRTSVELERRGQRPEVRAPLSRPASACTGGATSSSTAGCARRWWRSPPPGNSPGSAYRRQPVASASRN